MAFDWCRVIGDFTNSQKAPGHYHYYGHQNGNLMRIVYLPRELRQSGWA